MNENLCKSTLLDGHSRVLVAISGGSDSTALLHLLLNANIANLHAATVDHGLRHGSADEALYVAEHCAKFRVDHAILNWSPNGRSSDAARIGRYELLADYAKSISATAIVLGHTQDDQAETILMRTKRMGALSGTRGLSGMSWITSYGELKLLRPLLSSRREELRAFLTRLGHNWMDDPSNINVKSERVRIRNLLTDGVNLPSGPAMARLAELSSRGRGWLSDRAAELIESRAFLDASGNIVLKNCSDRPSAVLSEVFSTLIQVCGGQPYRKPPHKLSEIVAACVDAKPLRKSIGNSLVKVRKGSVTFSKESRSKESCHPGQTSDPKLNCGSSHSILRLENFRPSEDDSQYSAVKQLLASSPCST